MDECEVCGPVDEAITHHVSYEPEVTVKVCWSCHYRIHNDEGFRPDLTPDVSPDEVGFEHGFDGCQIPVDERARDTLKLYKTLIGGTYSDAVVDLMEKAGYGELVGMDREQALERVSGN